MVYQLKAGCAYEWEKKVRMGEEEGGGGGGTGTEGVWREKEKEEG